MSLEASGKIGDSVVLSSWRGRSYMKKLSIPNQPDSGLQISTREMMRFISNVWESVEDIDRISWENFGPEKNLPAFNHYVSVNLERWGRFETPAQNSAQPGGGSLPTVTGWSATGFVNHVVLEINITSENDAWGIGWFRSLISGFTPGRENLKLIQLVQNVGVINVMDTPLAPGVYFYKFMRFATTGRHEVLPFEMTATVT